MPAPLPLPTDLSSAGANLLDLHALIDATPGVSLLFELDGKILCANDNAVRRFGLPMAELLGRDVYALFDPAVAHDRRAAVEKAIRLRQPVILEDARNGLFFRHGIVPVIDADQVVRRVAVFAEDVTERKLAELALRASEEKYRFLAENTADTVWQLDAQMRFTFVNGAYETLSGFPRDEVIGQSVMAFFTDEGRQIVGDMMARRRAAEAAGQSRQSLRFEVPHLRKHGEPFWAEINSTPIYGPHGAILAFNGIMRDVDERKRNETRLEMANRQLQAQLREIVKLQAQLQEQAIRDPLTGLHNRRFLEETLPRELARARREGYPLALIMVDMDRFKQINDTYGHAAGDTVLKAMAQLLIQGAREGDIICRYGGEEILVVLPNMPLEQACARAQTWVNALDQRPIVHAGVSIRATLSAGIATFPQGGNDIHALLGLADQALYRAKTRGRNRVECITTAGGG